MMTMSWARGAASLVTVIATGCAVVAPTPTPSPPMPSFQVLVDIGIFGGPPDLPPAYAISEFTDDTLLLLVDRDATQHLREVRWNGRRWEAVGGMDARLIPAEEAGPYLRTLPIGVDDGFSTDAVLLVGRVPNGPINRLEMEIDGAVGGVRVVQRPTSLHAFPAGTTLGREFTAFDARTFELDAGHR